MRLLFPPLNELTVFVISTTLLSLFFYMNGWSMAAMAFGLDVLGGIMDTIRQSPFSFHALLGVMALILLPTALLVALVVPLLLPFSQRDLRGMCLLVIMIDALVIGMFNVQLFVSERSMFHLIMAAYAACWCLVIHRAGERRDVERLMCSEQVNGLLTILAAVISVVSVWVAIEVFSLQWMNAYCAVTIVVCILFNLCLPETESKTD